MHAIYFDAFYPFLKALRAETHDFLKGLLELLVLIRDIDPFGDK